MLCNSPLGGRRFGPSAIGRFAYNLQVDEFFLLAEIGDDLEIQDKKQRRGRTGCPIATYLVVDDNEFMARALAALLEREHYRTVVSYEAPRRSIKWMGANSVPWLTSTCRI